MLVGELLCLVAEYGAELRQGEGEDSLQFGPPGMLPPALVAEFKEHKTEILKILREDEEMRCTTALCDDIDPYRHALMRGG